MRYRDRFIIYDLEDAKKIVDDFHKFAQHVRFFAKESTHHMGMFWSDIVQEVPKILLKPQVVKVVHKKLGPKNITCLRQELNGKNFRWVEGVHHEGFCPGCKKITVLKKRRKRLKIKG